MAETQVETYHFCYDFSGVELSAEQFWEVEKIIEVFRQELLNDEGDPIVFFQFGCNHDRIEWDDQDFSHMEIIPRVTISLDFEEFGAGRFNALTPKGVEGLLFRGRNKKQFNNELLSALVLERDRVAHGLYSDLHIPKIQKHMNKARGAILTSFRAAMTNWK
ncbi:hypothetical protein CN105_08870 [Sinorhizobium meliloti]|uniref:hypothetical protein n=1 Tax=Rhizobium meliloti TaxID=382 RepID=UPI000FD9D37E|nr:hypothetical protein [Sinorhizobium meliloti]RVN94752.1 hypothetical protein CN105_08870 [Sinorhizobium meliloti]